MAKSKNDKEILEETPRSPDSIGGKIQMSQDVVETIAGLAAREIDGIHSLGRSRLIAIGGDDPKRGISAEVGDKEAALDLEVIIEYGCNIRETAKSLRRRVAEEVDRMAGRKVVEINVDVVGVNIEPDEEEAPQPVARVQ